MVHIFVMILFPFHFIFFSLLILISHLMICPKYLDFQLILKMLSEKTTNQTYLKVETESPP